MKSAEDILLPVQADQQKHDSLAHRDILNLDTHTRLKHMILHFLKYAGKLATASFDNNESALKSTLVDTVIICFATANALNVSLGANIDIEASDLNNLCSKLAKNIDSGNPFKIAPYELVTIAGKMAKAIESTDHLEKGNPRAELEILITKLSRVALAICGLLSINLEQEIRNRWLSVESKSIFFNLG